MHFTVLCVCVRARVCVCWIGVMLYWSRGSLHIKADTCGKSQILLSNLWCLIMYQLRLTHNSVILT